MIIFEIGTGYTSIPAQIGAATEIVVEELSRSLIKLEHDVRVIDIKDKNRTASDLPISEVPVPPLFHSTDTQLGIIHKLKRIIYSLYLTFLLKKLIKKEKEAIILHFHNQYNLFFFLKLTSKRMRKNVKIAYTNHSYIWQGEWKDIEKTVHSRYFQEIYCMRHADKVFVLNEKTKEHLEKRLAVDKNSIFLIPNGVNTTVYASKSEAEKQQFKKALGLDGKTVFLQVGSVCDRKNQLAALQLVLPLLKKNPSFVYVYAGGIVSEEYQKLIHISAQANAIENQVIYAGELKPGEQLNRYYNVAATFLFPSVSEGFSLVVLEALSAGLPVLADANNGVKLPESCLCYTDEESFISLINQVILNEEEYPAQVEKGLKTIREKYSWDTVAKIYIRNFMDMQS